MIWRAYDLKNFENIQSCGRTLPAYPMMMAFFTVITIPLLRFISLTLTLHSNAHGWQQWNYSAYTTDDWRDIWGFPNGPRSRRGHTMVLYNSTQIILFGGRDNEVHLPHVPKTY